MFERAEELGRQLGQSEEYKRLRRADEGLKADAEASKLLGELQEFDEKLREAISSGNEPDASLVEQYESARRKIEALANYQAFIAAQMNFDKLMQKVNARILEGLKKGAESPIITLG